MTADLLALMWMPFLMCLVLTGIHAYLWGQGTEPWGWAAVGPGRH